MEEKTGGIADVQNTKQPQSIISPHEHKNIQTSTNANKQEQHHNRNQSSINIHLLQSVICSNEEIIKSQSQQIRAIHMQLIKTEEELNKYKLKCHKLQQQLTLISNSEQLTKRLSALDSLEKQLHTLESELIGAKLSLAIKSSDSLEKDAMIRDLNQKNRLLDEEMEKMSVVSGGTDTNSNSQEITNRNRAQSFTSRYQEIDKFTMIEVTKDNLQEFIEPTTESHESIFISLKNIIDNEILKKTSSSENILKAWEKQVAQHIQPKTKRFSFSSLYNKQLHLQKFLKETTSLLKKNYGMPHNLRNKVWPFVTEDRLGISNALYIELLERRGQGWVAEKIKLQIERDILRSFNGEGSKDKLLKIFEIGLAKSKSETEDKSKFARGTVASTVGETQLSEGPQEHQKQQLPDYCTKKYPSDLPCQTIGGSSKSLSVPLPFQPHSQRTQKNFRIAEDVTEVLELFYIYRPDIGFVQGMTYPAIILTLAVGKLNSFRILCNLLLGSEFFRKMITFQPSFINYFCRIFDQLLLSFHLNLYNRVVRQFQIKSQVFLVDWFFTFFSRGITPMTILRVWDLLLYQSSLNPKLPELVIYRLSLIIFELLEPIIMQANYEESIRTIRDYPRKVDEEELIRRLYEAMKDSSSVKTFEEKYLKVKQRVEKRYEVEMEAI